MADPVAQRALVKRLVESDVAFLWEDSGVELVEQVKLAQSGYRTIRIFVGLADTKAEVRVALARDFELDPAAQGALPRVRLQVACILSAWTAAGEMASRESQLRVESKTLGVTKPLSVPERKAMKRVYEDTHGKLPSSEQPSPLYLSRKMEEVEIDEPSASGLDEVACCDDIDNTATSSGLDPAGRVIITTKHIKGSLPGGPEQFRMKLRVEANTWIYLAGKFTSKQWLRDLSPQLFQRYTDHFLGSKCNSMEIMDSSGQKSSLRPPWQIVLNYEYQCRKAAFEAVRDDDAQLSVQLMRVIRDPEIKEVHFTSPIALMGRGGKSAAAAPAAGAVPPGTRLGKSARKAANRLRLAAAAAKGSGKGQERQGKGAKGIAKGIGKGNLIDRTADGREVCYNFNSASGCSNASCSRVHICRIRGCSAAHSMLDHPAAA